MIYIISDYRGTYHYIVDKLRADSGAQLIELDPNRGIDRTISKLGILRQVATPRLLKLRRRWTADDTVLVISWYLVPVLLGLRLRLLPCPRRLVSMGAFVHDERVRRALNIVLRGLDRSELEMIAFSDAERRNLVDAVGIPASRVHRVVYRGSTREPLQSPPAKGEYVFTGGYSNRDYETFFAAAGRLDCQVVAVASKLNGIRDVPPNVDLRLDVSWEEFEQLLGGCALLVLPLRAGGEASGQNVLFRGLRHHRPTVATRHDSLVDYLGPDYPGFVAPHDPESLRSAIERGLHDPDFREALGDRVRAAARWLAAQDQLEDEIAAIVAAESPARQGT